MKKSINFAPVNPRAFFLKAISIQRSAFKVDFAELKLEESCTALLNAGFCSGCRSCNSCALQLAHEETRTLLSVPEIQRERYQRWKRRQRERNSHTDW